MTRLEKRMEHHLNYKTTDTNPYFEWFSQCFQVQRGSKCSNVDRIESREQTVRSTLKIIGFNTTEWQTKKPMEFHEL